MPGRTERRGITRPEGPLARAGLHGRMPVVLESGGSEKARKTGETARGGAGDSRRFTLVREGQRPLDLKR